LGGDTGTIQGSNRYATPEWFEPQFVLDHSAANTVWYRWGPPAHGGWYTFDLTAGTAFDSVLGIYQGNELRELAELSSNDNYGTKTSSRATFYALAGTNYSVVVSSSGYRQQNQQGSFVLAWYPTPPPSLSGSQFSPTTGSPGAKITLTGTNFTGTTAV